MIELMVVIAIISLLLSLLLPTVNRVRRSAETIACAANLRSILQGMHLYVAENRGFFPGGAVTTGRFLFTRDWESNLTYPVDNTHCPEVCQNWDWMSPVAKTMGLPFDTGATWDQRLVRFEQLRQYEVFQCPSNASLAGPASFSGTPTGGPAVSVDVSMSYATAIYFHLNPYQPGVGRGSRTHGFWHTTPPKGYAPMITKVGDATRKIYIADGARYSNSAFAPSVQIALRSDGGGAFGDHGAFSNRSNCWNRGKAPGNVDLYGGTIDPRIFAYRHGTREQFRPADEYKMNAGFFDGHVELIGDLQSADPSLWLPKGSFWDPDNPGTPISLDAAAKYGSGPRTID